MAIQTSDIIILMREAGIKGSIIQNINTDKPLLRQGIGSIDFPILASLAEKKFAVDLAEAKSSGIRSINDFVQYINTHKTI